jgi:hypothetical protein
LLKKKFKTQGRPETCRRTGQVNDSASLKTAILYTFLAHDLDRGNFEGGFPNRRKYSEKFFRV